MKRKELDGYLKREDISIEGNIAIWSIKAHGKINGTYLGTFKFKCYLTPSEQLAAGREYRNLLGQNATLAFKKEDNLAFTLSQLKYRVVSAPPFWNTAVSIDGLAGDIPDDDVLDVILEAAIASELKFSALLEKKKLDAVKKTKEAAENILEQKDSREIEEDE